MKSYNLTNSVEESFSPQICKMHESAKHSQYTPKPNLGCTISLGVYSCCSLNTELVTCSVCIKATVLLLSHHVSFFLHSICDRKYIISHKWIYFYGKNPTGSFLFIFIFFSWSGRTASRKRPSGGASTVAHSYRSYHSRALNNSTSDLVTHYSFTYMDRWQSNRLGVCFYHWLVLPLWQIPQPFIRSTV